MLAIVPMPISRSALASATIRSLHEEAQVAKEQTTEEKVGGAISISPTTGLVVRPSDRLAEQLPSCAVELLQLHLLDRLKIVRTSR
jgi:hypothetical protein